MGLPQSEANRNTDTFITGMLGRFQEQEDRIAQLEADEGSVPFSLSFAFIQDQKAANTAGGGATSGSWFTRTLNTIVSDPDSIVSLSSNQFTLQAGTYIIKASAPAYQVNEHKIRLRNITSGATLAVGTSAYGDSSTGAQGDSFINALIVLSAVSVLEIQHRVTTSRINVGLGVPSGAWGEVEVYACVEIMKIN